MSIANTVKWYLDSEQLSYEILQHPHTSSSAETAGAAYIWEDQLAKSVLLEDRVDLKRLRESMHRPLELATEAELGEIFADCEIGAVPPLGQAYGIPMIYDDCLTKLANVYFEAGDHEDLVYMGGAEFMQLLGKASHAKFSTPI
ncbi:MAG: YbaK/EbsC family protein [Deltaproteobacteria bacterium]|nr:YbaK/EbsC family protein [Deltaproteobacteria bacterium]